MLELEHVSYTAEGGKEILKDITMSVKSGETVVVTGPNGGGKTTLVKTISGVAPQTEGKIILDGKDISDKDITERAKEGISYAFQQPVRFKGITTRDLIELSHGERMPLKECYAILEAVGLNPKEYINREVGASLSGGEIKRIEIASIINRESKVFLFDEPEAGIDLWSFTNLINVFEHLKKNSDAAIIIISHQERIMNIADKIAVIDGGELTDFGPKDEILPKLYEKEEQRVQ